ncbi:MAG: helix-turn-helix transcriptional regulator [Elusimicrobiota bacterium]|jgi:transcriptional regulator with XRE-family HTH domain|nr:helix-turn-helix transcriptional regulator [Elusimicrobiota bacterium]
MKRLKQLRESFKLTQQQLAEKLKTSQQTIARWETGKSEPNLYALKDLALVFGTSVDELLNYGATGEKPTTKHYSLFSDEADGFWGHIGLKIAGKPSLWFPITANTMNRIYNRVKNINKENEWLIFPTLANKLVACRPESIDKMILLDDDGDHPQDDWEITLPYSGLPLEIYHAFNILTDAEVSIEEWEKANKIISKLDKGEAFPVADRKVWGELIKKVIPVFEGNASEEFINGATEEFVRYSLYDLDKYYQNMHTINVYCEDGSIENFDSEPEDLDNLIFTIDNMEFKRFKLINFTKWESPIFMPFSKISAIIMPYTEVLKIEKISEEEPAKD